MSETFRTTILQTGKNTCGIRVPPEVVVALGAGKRPKVVVTLDHYTYRYTIAPYSGDVYMIGLSSRAPGGIGSHGR